jgi:hypothetical protein
MQAWLYSIVELTFGLLTSVACATVLCILTLDDLGDISLLQYCLVLCWVSNLTVSYEICVIGIDIYLCPHNIPLNSFG